MIDFLFFYFWFGLESIRKKPSTSSTRHSTRSIYNAFPNNLVFFLITYLLLSSLHTFKKKEKTEAHALWYHLQKKNHFELCATGGCFEFVSIFLWYVRCEMSLSTLRFTRAFELKWSYQRNLVHFYTLTGCLMLYVLTSQHIHRYADAIHYSSFWMWWFFSAFPMQQFVGWTKAFCFFSFLVWEHIVLFSIW